MSGDIKEKSRVLKKDLHNYIDSHIREIRYGVYCLGTVGALLCLRSLRPFAKFTKIEEIPETFIKKNIMLQGTVKDIGERGKLLVEHEPMIRTPWKTDSTCIPLVFAHLSIGPQGRLWLVKNMKNKYVWFQPLALTEEEALGCIIYSKGPFWMKQNINEKMVKIGMSKIKEDPNLEINSKQSNFLNKLIKLEAVADRKGVGIWAVETEKSLASRVLQSILKSVVNVFKYAGSKVSKRVKG